MKSKEASPKNQTPNAMYPGKLFLSMAAALLLFSACSKDRSVYKRSSNAFFIKKTYNANRANLLATDTLWTGPPGDIDTSNYPSWQYICNPPTWEYYFIK